LPLGSAHARGGGAERGAKAGYPERYAQQALGHNSKAVHRAYARKAQVKVPPLEDPRYMLPAPKVAWFETAV
jgi:hypothetical protein